MATMLVSELGRKKMVDKNGRVWWIIGHHVSVPDEINGNNLRSWFPNDFQHLKVKRANQATQSKSKKENQK